MGVFGEALDRLFGIGLDVPLREPDPHEEARRQMWKEASTAKEAVRKIGEQDPAGYLDYLLSQVPVWKEANHRQLKDYWGPPGSIIQGDTALAPDGRRFESPAGGVLRCLYSELQRIGEPLFESPLELLVSPSQPDFRDRVRQIQAVFRGNPADANPELHEQLLQHDLYRIIATHNLHFSKWWAARILGKVGAGPNHLPQPEDNADVADELDPEPHPDKQSRPEPVLIRHPRDAEEAAARWMRYWGWRDARVTPVGVDEGIDVVAAQAVAQVKAHMNPIGRPDVQNLFGVASAEKKLALFFSLRGYTAEAKGWANKAGVGLFAFDLQGEPEPINQAAQQMIRDQSARSRGA